MDLIHRYFKVMMLLLFFVPFIFEVAESAESGKKNIEVSLSYKLKLHGNFNVEKFKLNHPIKISHSEIISHLVSLRYKGAFLGNKEEPVFSKPEIKKLAPLLMKKFAEVNPDKIIHVELKRGGKVTSGDIFSFRKYLNWRFDSIHGEPFFQKNDVRRWSVYAWRLIPQKGQLYFKSGADRGKRLQRNWIVANLHLSVPEKSSENSVGNKTDSSINNFDPILEKKLEHLKYLHDKKLLNDEEYENQQNRLLDDLL